MAKTKIPDLETVGNRRTQAQSGRRPSILITATVGSSGSAPDTLRRRQPRGHPASFHP